MRELLDDMQGRHAVLRKELFAQRRELVLWTSRGLLVSSVNVVITWYGGYLNIVGRASIGDIIVLGEARVRVTWSPETASGRATGGA